jgi:hypothetical protein
MSDHTSVIVQSIPDCDMCKQDGEKTPAYADAALVFGSWGYVCVSHFNQFGKGLGMGRGQRLLLDPESASERTLSEDDDEDDDTDPVVDTVFNSPEHEAAAKYLADLIAKRDKAHAAIPLSDKEREGWNRRIAKASIIMHSNAMLAVRR